MPNEPIRLTEENYYTPAANQAYMSASQYKAFLRCEAAALADLRGEIPHETSTAMLVGSYVDAYFSGTLDEFKRNHVELFKRDGTLKSEYAQADYIIECIKEQPVMMHLMSGDAQRIFTGEIAGVPFKAKLDSYLEGEAIVDGKVMKDFAPVYVPGEGRLPWYQAWHYDTQGAIYQELVRQNTGEKLPFILSAATKETEPDLVALNVAQWLLDYELDRVKENAPRFDAIKKGLIEPTRCGKCAYCRRTKVVTIINSEELDNETEA